jgi:hypothetical protein
MTSLDNVESINILKLQIVAETVPLPEHGFVLNLKTAARFVARPSASADF